MVSRITSRFFTASSLLASVGLVQNDRRIERRWENRQYYCACLVEVAENSTPNFRFFPLDNNRTATMIVMLRPGECVMLFFDNRILNMNLITSSAESGRVSFTAGTMPAGGELRIDGQPDRENSSRGIHFSGRGNGTSSRGNRLSTRGNPSSSRGKMPSSRGEIPLSRMLSMEIVLAVPDHKSQKLEAGSCLSEVGETASEVGEFEVEVGEFRCEVGEFDPEVGEKALEVVEKLFVSRMFSTKIVPGGTGSQKLAASS